MRGKTGRLVKRNIAVSLLLGMLSNNLSFADNLIKVKEGVKARVTKANNGTPMIELANPNGKGILITR